MSMLCLVGAKPQEDFSLSKNERSAVGGRPSASGGRRPAVGWDRSFWAVGSRRSALGAEVDGRLSEVGGRYF